MSMENIEQTIELIIHEAQEALKDIDDIRKGCDETHYWALRASIDAHLHTIHEMTEQIA